MNSHGNDQDLPAGNDETDDQWGRSKLQRPKRHDDGKYDERAACEEGNRVNRGLQGCGFFIVGGLGHGAAEFPNNSAARHCPGGSITAGYVNPIAAIGKCRSRP
jgi:hypothetical protein